MDKTRSPRGLGFLKIPVELKLKIDELERQYLQFVNLRDCDGTPSAMIEALDLDYQWWENYLADLQHSIIDIQNKIKAASGGEVE